MVLWKWKISLPYFKDRWHERTYVLGSPSSNHIMNIGLFQWLPTHERLVLFCRRSVTGGFSPVQEKLLEYGGWTVSFDLNLGDFGDGCFENHSGIVAGDDMEHVKACRAIRTFGEIFKKLFVNWCIFFQTLVVCTTVPSYWDKVSAHYPERVTWNWTH